jgi:hypothetical protein
MGARYDRDVLSHVRYLHAVTYTTLNCRTRRDLRIRRLCAAVRGAALAISGAAVQLRYIYPAMPGRRHIAPMRMKCCWEMSAGQDLSS